MAEAVTKLKASISNAENVTLEDVLEVGKKIWADVRAAGIPVEDTKKRDDLLEQMRKQYPDFAQSYPIVLRYMCQMNSFHRKAFKNYLNDIQVRPWKNHDEYLESQAKYVVFLYKATNRRWNSDEAQSIYTNTLRMLQTEHKEFMERADKVKQEVETEERILKERGYAEMVKFYSKHGAETLHVPIRIQSELLSDPPVNISDILASCTADTEDSQSSSLMFGEI